FAPPLGMYRLMVPGGAPYDFSNGAPVGTPGIAQLWGPTRLELVTDPARSSLSAQVEGGRFNLADVAIDDGQTVVGPRGRIKIGAPLGADELARLGPQSAELVDGRKDDKALAEMRRASEEQQQRIESAQRGVTDAQAADQREAARQAEALKPAPAPHQGAL